MSRAKLTAEYYPHFANQGKTIKVLKALFGMDGYGVWHQLLEQLCSARGHFLDLNSASETEVLAAEMPVSVEKLEIILRKLAERGNIDQELWDGDRIVWCQNLVDNLAPLYLKRKAAPERPIPSRNLANRHGIDEKVVNLPGSKVKDSIVKESRECEDPPPDGSDILDGMDQDEEKPKKHRQPRSMAVIRYHELTGKWPNSVQIKAIDEAILTDADVDTWEVAIKTWLMRGFSPMGVEGMLDWFKNGIPRNGKKPSQAPDMADGSRFDDFKRIEEEQKRKEAERAERGG